MTTRSVQGLHVVDDLGRWTIRLEEDCDYCGKLCAICVKSRKDFDFTEKWLKVESTILKKAGKQLGVTCGCYAKFHRQVTHIRNRRHQSL